MKKLLILLLPIIFTFCAKKKEHYLPRLIVKHEKKAIEVNSNQMLHIDSPNIIAVDFLSDTIIDEKIDIKKTNESYVNFQNIDTLLPKYSFKITIDDSYTIPANHFEYKNIDFPKKEYRIENGLINGKIPNENDTKISGQVYGKYYETMFDQWKDYVSCYPLLIQNKETKPAFIRNIALIQEAKDSDGLWKPIEFYNEAPTCVVTHIFYKIKPKKFDAVPIIKYHGDFNTKIRVKTQMNGINYYSNEINGSINKTQFDKTRAKDCMKIWYYDRQDSFFEGLNKYMFLENGK